MMAVLLTMPQSYRLFFLDVDFQIAAGFVAFAFIARARKRGAKPDVALGAIRPA